MCRVGDMGFPIPGAVDNWTIRHLREEVRTLTERVLSLEGSREYDREIRAGADW